MPGRVGFPFPGPSRPESENQLQPRITVTASPGFLQPWVGPALVTLAGQVRRSHRDSPTPSGVSPQAVSGSNRLRACQRGTGGWDRTRESLCVPNTSHFTSADSPRPLRRPTRPPWWTTVRGCLGLERRGRMHRAGAREGTGRARWARLLPPGGSRENLPSAVSSFQKGLRSWCVPPTSQRAVWPL